MPMTKEGTFLKGAVVVKSVADEGDLALINRHALEPLTLDDVYTFRVVMCDNEVDRTYEAFDEPSLAKLAELFDGKTVIKDHVWSSDNQIGRIYKTAVEHPGGTTKNGDVYAQLVAWVYMIDNESNASVIAEIKGGVKREVSVGFRAGSVTCSVCGADNTKTWCEHRPGRTYDGVECWFLIGDVTDAYELSFVSVPAQPAAGTVKFYGVEPPDDERGDGACSKAGSGQETKTLADERELEARERLAGAFVFSETSKEAQ